MAATDSIEVTVDTTLSSIEVTVQDVSPSSFNIELSSGSISVNQNPFPKLRQITDVSQTPGEGQVLAYDGATDTFIWIDNTDDSVGIVPYLVSPITVTNQDDAFDALVDVTYTGGDTTTLEEVLRNILDPTPASTITFSETSPTASGVYEVGSSARLVSNMSVAVSSVSAFDDAGLSVLLNGSGSGVDNIVPTTVSNTSYALSSSIDVSSATYSDSVFLLRATDEDSLNGRVAESETVTIKIRPRHLLYGSTTTLSEGASQASIQSLYDAIVSATSSLAAEQLVDRADEYTYSNTDNKYNLETDDTWTYYFYEAYLGELTDIKLGGSQGLEIDDAFIHVTNGGAVSLSNGEVSTDYHVYRSRNKKAFTSNQTLYFKN